MEKLSTYRRKRDFQHTAEPSGDVPIAAADRLRFVVQKHDATRLHYDFRLEFDGVFKSWAVTKGPSLDPHDKRLAVEVEDHPLAYGDFEGVIPKGQYGGGTVMLWDRGYWAPEPGVDVAKALKKGELKFVLQGDRLKGGFVLVRMARDRDGGKRTNWLLIKHHDDFATEAAEARSFLEDNETSVASGRPMPAIAQGEGKGPSPFIVADAPPAARSPRRVWRSNRDDKAQSVEVTAQGKAEPAAMPRFVAPQLCRIVDRPPAGPGWTHEIKFDGYRMQLRASGGKARLYTRRGLDWSARFAEIVAEGAGLGEALIDGEAVALDAEGSPDFAGLQDALATEDTGGLVYFAFDLLFHAGEDLRERPLAERKARLKTLLDQADPGSQRLRFVDHFDAAGEAVLRSACALHLEGVVSKRLDAPYRSGRGEAWTKAKCRGGQEVILAGWVGEGERLRSLIAAVNRNDRLVHVGRIGTGFSRQTVERLMPRLREAAAEASPFAAKGAPRETGEVHWLRPVLVAEIQSAGWTGSGALRQASFKGLREDKVPDEVVREAPQPVEQVEQATEEKVDPPVRKGHFAALRGGGKDTVMGVRLSHPEKILWPAADGEPAHTKRDLALYWEAMAPAILPHIVGRPSSILRCPDGIEGQAFVQRHAGAGTSSLVSLVEVAGDHQPYLRIDRPEALVAIAQSGGIEIHPWNCAPDQPEIPGRLVFDLDPAPDVAFSVVIEAAREVRDRLADLGLQSFPKTTGGKGLHVVVPLKPDPKVDWPAAKAFARHVCEAMAADAPDRYLTTMAKAKRTGRIFLDYLRNDRTATAVAPFSPRARPGATVSWPLTWSQVRQGLDPKRYTLSSALDLSGEAAKAWADYDEAARGLAAAIERLGKP